MFIAVRHCQAIPPALKFKKHKDLAHIWSPTKARYVSPGNGLVPKDASTIQIQWGPIHNKVHSTPEVPNPWVTGRYQTTKDWLPVLKRVGCQSESLEVTGLLWTSSMLVCSLPVSGLLVCGHSQSTVTSGLRFAGPWPKKVVNHCFTLRNTWLHFQTAAWVD